jgi:hypothetical protein
LGLARDWNTGISRRRCGEKGTRWILATLFELFTIRAGSAVRMLRATFAQVVPAAFIVIGKSLYLQPKIAHPFNLNQLKPIQL